MMQMLDMKKEIKTPVDIISQIPKNQVTTNVLVNIQQTQQKQPIIQQKAKIENMCLDNYKVQGLKDLCNEHKLNTSKCKNRNDYVSLLLHNGIK